MYWVIEYKNNKSISENEINFKDVSKDNMKRFYFYDNHLPIGYENDTGYFFIGKSKYDFKVGNGPFMPIQFKKSQLLWALDKNVEEELVSRNIGYYKQNGNQIYKYILSINNKKEVVLNATKEDLNGKVIQSRELKLR